MSTVTISRKEYNKLLQAQSELDALEAAGVDNWEGYSEAMQQQEDEEDIYGEEDE